MAQRQQFYVLEDRQRKGKWFVFDGWCRGGAHESVAVFFPGHPNSKEAAEIECDRLNKRHGTGAAIIEGMKK